jgi:bifunctional protein pyrR
MITRIANEIIEQNKLDDIVLVGIQTRGIHIAKRLKQKIKEIENTNIPVETLDIKFYRDDLEKISDEPEIKVPRFKLDLTNKVVIIVDDVLYTGRTVRAAIDAIMDASRPKAIRLAILVDRGHRELPIRADHIGKNIPTSRKENVKVHLNEVDDVEEILLI